MSKKKTLLLFEAILLMTMLLARMAKKLPRRYLRSLIHRRRDCRPSLILLRPILFETGNWANTLEPELLARCMSVLFHGETMEARVL